MSCSAGPVYCPYGGRAIATFLNFYVSHGSTARFLRGGEKYIYTVFQKK